MLKVASYNIRKAVGLDRRRDPERILAVLREVDADIVALQEADLRFGSRATALPLHLIEALTHYRPVALDTRPDSIGWHGNAILVRRTIEIADGAIIPLPTLEPRGAVRAELLWNGQPLRIIGMHLDLSGIRRRQQVRAIMHHCRTLDDAVPTIMMGDLNEWSLSGGALREFGADLEVLAPGRSFHSRRPFAQLDRIIVPSGLVVSECAVHHSHLASRASDHLPVWARLQL